MKKPESNIRWNTKADLQMVKRAAKQLNLSLNQFVVGRALLAARQMLQESASEAK